MNKKYNELNYLDEINKYINSTYGEHYVEEDGAQAMDLIVGCGSGEGFCRGNIIKYAARFGKKNGRNRVDILKIIHYCLFWLYVFDKEVQPVKKVKQHD